MKRFRVEIITGSSDTLGMMEAQDRSRREISQNYAAEVPRGRRFILPLEETDSFKAGLPMPYYSCPPSSAGHRAVDEEEDNAVIDCLRDILEEGLSEDDEDGAVVAGEEEEVAIAKGEEGRGPQEGKSPSNDATVRDFPASATSPTSRPQGKRTSRNKDEKVDLRKIATVPAASSHASVKAGNRVTTSSPKRRKKSAVGRHQSASSATLSEKRKVANTASQPTKKIMMMEERLALAERRYQMMQQLLTIKSCPTDGGGDRVGKEMELKSQMNFRKMVVTQCLGGFSGGADFQSSLGCYHDSILFVCDKIQIGKKVFSDAPLEAFGGPGACVEARRNCDKLYKKFGWKDIEIKPMDPRGDRFMITGKFEFIPRVDGTDQEDVTEIKALTDGGEDDVEEVLPPLITPARCQCVIIFVLSPENRVTFVRSSFYTSEGWNFTT